MFKIFTITLSRDAREFSWEKGALMPFFIGVSLGGQGLRMIHFLRITIENLFVCLLFCEQFVWNFWIEMAYVRIAKSAWWFRCSRSLFYCHICVYFVKVLARHTQWYLLCRNRFINLQNYIERVQSQLFLLKSGLTILHLGLYWPKYFQA